MKANIAEFIIKIKQKKVGSSKLIWLWVDIEPKDKRIRSITMPKERNIFMVAERFLSLLLKEYTKHPVSTTECGL